MKRTSNQELASLRRFCHVMTGVLLTIAAVCGLAAVLAPDSLWVCLGLVLAVFLLLCLRDQVETRLKDHLEQGPVRFLRYLPVAVCFLLAFAAAWFAGVISPLLGAALLVMCGACASALEVLLVLRKLSGSENG